MSDVEHSGHLNEVITKEKVNLIHDIDIVSNNQRVEVHKISKINNILDEYLLNILLEHLGMRS